MVSDACRLFIFGYTHTGVTALDRQAAVARFQSDASVRAAVLSLRAAGQGLTLTAASTVVFAELDVTPGLMLQAEDRVHRIGQQEAVNIHYLVARGTLDERVWRMVERKHSVLGRTLDGAAAGLHAPAANEIGGAGGVSRAPLVEDGVGMVGGGARRQTAGQPRSVVEALMPMTPRLRAAAASSTAAAVSSCGRVLGAHAGQDRFASPTGSSAAPGPESAQKSSCGPDSARKVATSHVLEEWGGVIEDDEADADAGATDSAWRGQGGITGRKRRFYIDSEDDEAAEHARSEDWEETAVLRQEHHIDKLGEVRQHLMPRAGTACLGPHTDRHTPATVEKSAREMEEWGGMISDDEVQGVDGHRQGDQGAGAGGKGGQGENSLDEHGGRERVEADCGTTVSEGIGQAEPGVGEPQRRGYGRVGFKVSPNTGRIYVYYVAGLG